MICLNSRNFEVSYHMCQMYRLMTEHTESKIARLAMSGSDALEIRENLQAFDQIEVSGNTIRRSLRRSGLVARVRRTKLFLSKKHQKQRLAFALKYKNWTNEDWKKVCFSDESKFELFNTSRRQYCWKRPGAPLMSHHIKPSVKHPLSIMIWGCFTSEGIGNLVLIDGTLDAKLYCRILKEDFLGTLGWYNLSSDNIVFQQDNDPKHTSKLAKSWFADNNIKVLDWPSQSPDLNPIEHLWDEVDRRLRKLPNHPTNRGDLWEKITDVWNSVDLDVCTKLIDSMPQRIQKVIAAKGGYIK